MKQNHSMILVKFSGLCVGALIIIFGVRQVRLNTKKELDIAASLTPPPHVVPTPSSEITPLPENTSPLPEVEKVELQKNVFIPDFVAATTIWDAGSVEESQDLHWWLNSGGKAIVGGGQLKTIYGELRSEDPLRIKYRVQNASSTDDGFHPQNIFRLISRRKWLDVDQQVYFTVDRIHQSSSQNRNASNAVLLFNRYVDQDNLYYAGLRVDGAAIIKKKKDGGYYTMAALPIFFGEYNRENQPNLIPLHKPIGIRTVVKNISKNQVSITLYLDTLNTGNWTQVLHVIDDASKFGGNAHVQPAAVGIRTDFMDVSMSKYKLTAL